MKIQLNLLIVVILMFGLSCNADDVKLNHKLYDKFFERVGVFCKYN